MSLIVLFDLDDTLLQTNMGNFLPAYFEALGQAFKDIAKKDAIINQVQYAAYQMTQNQDPGRFLKEVFSEHFYPPLGVTEDSCKELQDQFYNNDYPKLRGLTQVKPEAADLISWCKSQPLTLAIATNPLFPAMATRQRIQWAGLNIEDFSFFTAYHNSHFTKPNLSYYAEVLGRLGWPDDLVVMVGDSLSYDLIPVELMGHDTFWVTHNRKFSGKALGSIGDVKSWIDERINDKPTKLSKSLPVSLAILRSTPAVLHTILDQLIFEDTKVKTANLSPKVIELIFEMAQIEKLEFQKPLLDLHKPHEKILQSDFSSRVINEEGKWNLVAEKSFNLFLNTRKRTLSLIEQLSKNNVLSHASQNQPNATDHISEIAAKLAENDRFQLGKIVNLLNIYKIN